MKKLLSKTNVFVLVSMFLLTCFNSCDKKEESLKGTTWVNESERFIYDPPESEYYYLSPLQYDPGITYLYGYKKLSIDFITDDEANIMAHFTIFELSYKYASGSYGGSIDRMWEETYKGSATYTYEDNDLSIKVKWKNSGVYEIDNGKWTGRVNGEKMTLKHLFNFKENITFSKN